jgi:hypothetical protein
MWRGGASSRRPARLPLPAGRQGTVSQVLGVGARSARSRRGETGTYHDEQRGVPAHKVRDTSSPRARLAVRHVARKRRGQLAQPLSHFVYR